MTVISVHHPAGAIDSDARRVLAVSLTDAVMAVECGQVTEAARIGFQVHFHPIDRDAIAIGGTLLADRDEGTTAGVVDIAVMDGAWSVEDRKRVVEAVGEALAKGLGLPAPSPSWWVLLRVIADGSWGIGASAISMLDLLDLGGVTPERAALIRRELGVDAAPDAP